MKDKFRICALQPDIHPGEAEENFESIRRLAEEAAGEFGALDLMALPENFFLRTAAKYSESAAEAAMEFLRDLAADLSVNLVGGSFHQYQRDEGGFFNVCPVFNRKGEVIGSYRKRKLYDRELKCGVKPGNSAALFDIEGWKVGVLICADFWYPETSREIYTEADIIAVPSQSVVRNPDYRDYGRSLWWSLAMTRAQENAVVTAVADHPSYPRKPYCSGASSICDPSMGIETSSVSVIHRRIEDGSPGALAAEIDKVRLNEFRKYRAEKGMPSGGQIYG